MKEENNISYPKFVSDDQEKRRNHPSGVVWLPVPAVHRPVPRAKDDDLSKPGATKHEATFGFSGPEDRVVSLNVPTEGGGGGGGEQGIASFDIEYDPEHPEMLTISLMGMDQDNFIHTIQRSIPFPAKLLAELLGRRQATEEEIASWQAASDEDE